MYLIFIVSFIAALLVQSHLRNTYARWQKQPGASGLTGAQVARLILDANGLHDVRVEEVPGQLTDHFDPKKGVVNLSAANYRSWSVAAQAVAAHEVGHAIQLAQGYAPLKARTALVPLANIGTGFGPWIIIIGAMIGALGLVNVGIILFALAVAFQLVTLPVEYDASRRAGLELSRLGVATRAEVGGMKQVLNAAALTYVAAAATSLVYLLYFLGLRRS